MKFVAIASLAVLSIIPCALFAQAPKATSDNVVREVQEALFKQYRLRDTEYRFPVELEEAVVTYANNEWDVAFIADSTSTIHVKLLKGDRDRLKAGNTIRAKGVATHEEPYILTDLSYEILSHSTTMPEATPTTVSQLTDLPPSDSLVELSGVIRTVSFFDDFVILEMSEGKHRCRVFIGPLPEGPSVQYRPGQTVSLLGAASTHGDFTEKIVYCETERRVKILDATATSIPDQPTPVQLANFNKLHVGQWVSIEGRINTRLDADHFTIDSGEVGCCVESVSGFMANSGDIIHIRGKTTHVDGGLRVNSVLSKTKRDTTAKTKAIETQVNQISPYDVYRDLSIRGELLSIEAEGDATLLKLRDENSSEFFARLPKNDSVWLNETLPKAQWLLVRGELQPGKPATLLVSRSENCKVVSSKPSVYFAMLLSLLGFGVTLGALLVAWTVMLRRTVEKRTMDLENVLARLRNTYEASRAAIAIVDEHGIVIEANSKFPTILGHKCDAGTELHALKQHLTSNCENEAALRLELTNVENDPFAEATFAVALPEATSQDGKTRYVEVHTSPVHSAESKVVLRQWAFYDTTETKQLESRLVQSQKLDAIGRLTGGVAHDFNNLLTAIRGNLELARLASSEPNRSPKEYIQTAERAVDRASEIVAQLLSFSRKSSLERKPGNANIVIAELCTLLRHSFGAKAVINTNLDESLWISDFDETYIGQVIMNLCLNARDALHNGRGNIFISTTNIEGDDAQFVRISVRDDGQGFDQHTHAKIFEPFFTTKEPGKGSGLGLAMSLGIIEQHGGRITCESTVDEGTCFRIDLPRSTQADVPREAEPTHETETPTDAQSITENDENTHVLVIDDEAMIRNLAKTILEHGGYQVSLACDGRTALAKLSEDRSISAVLLDQTMPGISGKETLRAIKQHHPHIAVVLSSGSSMDHSQFEDCRPDSFLSKPYRFEELLRSIRECQKAQNKTAA